MIVDNERRAEFGYGLQPRTPVAARVRSTRGLAERSAMMIAASLPLTGIIEIQLIGTLFLQDILAIPLLIFLVLYNENLSKLLRPIATLIVFQLTWLIGAISSDILANSPLEDLTRGWSKISLFFIHTTVIWLLSRGSLKIISVYIFFVGVAYLIEGTLFPSALQEIEPWKFGIGTGFLLTVATISYFPLFSRRLIRHIPIILMIFIALISLFLNSRSLFAVSLLGVVYTIGVKYLISMNMVNRFINRYSFILVVFLGIIFIQTLISGYGELANQGLLGEEARNKYEMQTSADMSLLQGGRPESLVSIQAIKDSPFFGHGSWARDRYYTSLFFSELRVRGLIAEQQWWQYNETQAELIPSHSHLLGSWVEAGILAVPIWVYAIFISFEALFAVLKNRSLPCLLVTITAFSIIWDVFFSPFAADGRILKAAQLSVLISATYSFRVANRHRGIRRFVSRRT